MPFPHLQQVPVLPCSSWVLSVVPCYHLQWKFLALLLWLCCPLLPFLRPPYLPRCPFLLPFSLSPSAGFRGQVRGNCRNQVVSSPGEHVELGLDLLELSPHTPSEAPPPGSTRFLTGRRWVSPYPPWAPLPALWEGWAWHWGSPQPPGPTHKTPQGPSPCPQSHAEVWPTALISVPLLSGLPPSCLLRLGYERCPCLPQNTELQRYEDFCNMPISAFLLVHGKMSRENIPYYVLQINHTNPPLPTGSWRKMRASVQCAGQNSLIFYTFSPNPSLLFIFGL